MNYLYFADCFPGVLQRLRVFASWQRCTFPSCPASWTLVACFDAFISCMFTDSPQALALLTKTSRSVAPWVFGGSRGARSSWEGRKTGNRSSFHGKRSEFPCSFAPLKRSLPALLLPKFRRSKWVRGSTLRNFNYVSRCYTLIGQMMSVEISLKLRRKTENTCRVINADVT